MITSYTTSHVIKYIKKNPIGKYPDNPIFTLCGQNPQSQSVNKNLTMGTLCKNCQRSTTNTTPAGEEVWWFVWHPANADDYLPRGVRDAANVGSLRLTVRHEGDMTQMWVRQASTSPRTVHSVRDLTSMTKLWIDSQYYKSIRLPEYLKHILNEQASAQI